MRKCDSRKWGIWVTWKDSANSAWGWDSIKEGFVSTPYTATVFTDFRRELKSLLASWNAWEHVESAVAKRINLPGPAK